MKNVFKMKLSEMNNGQFTMFCVASVVFLYCVAFAACAVAAMLHGMPFEASKTAMHALAVAGPIALINMIVFGLKRFVQLDRDPHPHAAEC